MSKKRDTEDAQIIRDKIITFLQHNPDSTMIVVGKLTAGQWGYLYRLVSYRIDDVDAKEVDALLRGVRYEEYLENGYYDN